MSIEMQHKAVYLLFCKFTLHVSVFNHTHHQEYTKLWLQPPVLVISFLVGLRTFQRPGTCFGLNETTFRVFYILGSVHRYSRLKKSNKMQQYADIYLLQNYSTCFGRPSRPSTGVHKTVVATSGTDHTVWGANWLKRDRIRTPYLVTFPHCVCCSECSCLL